MFNMVKGIGLMNLTLKQLEMITHGATCLEEREGGIYFWRMTPEQIQYYVDLQDEPLVRGAKQSAGVRLAFLTDSKTLSFSAALWPDHSGIFGGFDVYENGVMIEHVKTEGLSEWNAEVTLSAGESAVEIYFPWSKGVMLTSLCIDDGASLKPYRRSRKLLAFGDSITHGATAQYPSLTYVQRLARMLDADLENRGVGGDVFTSAIAALEPCHDPDIVTVAYGTNDWSWRTGERFDRECPATLEVLAKKYANAKIFVITPIWRKDWDRDAMSGKTFRDICREIRAYAEAYPNVTVIDAWNFVPHLSAFFADGQLHPNDLGMGIYAERLYCEIIKNL